MDNAGLSPAPPNALLPLGQLCGSRMVGQPPKAFNSLGSRWLFRREPVQQFDGCIVAMNVGEKPDDRSGLILAINPQDQKT